MNLIPIVQMKKRKILDRDQNQINDIIDLMSTEEKNLYILDLDGIEKNKPNLCTFQRLSKTYNLWVDSGPRNLGDIVDVFLSGATGINIRDKLWPRINLEIVREITENKIFVNLDFEKNTLNTSEEKIFEKADGIINLSQKEEIEKGFGKVEMIKKYQKKNKIFSYESNLQNLGFWKHIGIEDILVDLSKIKEFKSNGY